jgi:uncharacterized protein with NRDE domain
MCLIGFGLNAHPDYAFVLAANRDEFYDRPTAPAQFWDDAPHVLAGRDRRAGGTWMGVARDGRWAALTNVRDPDGHRDDAPSRGHLVSEYLVGGHDPQEYLEEIAARSHRYNGFNLLAGTPGRAWYHCNRDAESDRERVHAIADGVHGLSNAVLDAPWPKVERVRTGLREHLAAGTATPEGLFELLDDREPAPDDALPDTGVERRVERMLSSPFIVGDNYGTRSSTVLTIGRGGEVAFAERTFEGGTAAGTRNFRFRCARPPAASE